MWDADGNRYIDYVGSWGPLILGHAAPEVIEAIVAAARNGTSFGASTPAEAELAALVAEAYPAVEKVHYPGLPEHPGHKIAARQMCAFGGMMSIQVKGGREEAMGTVARCKLFEQPTDVEIVRRPRAMDHELGRLGRLVVRTGTPAHQPRLHTAGSNSAGDSAADGRRDRRGARRS